MNYLFINKIHFLYNILKYYWIQILKINYLLYIQLYCIILYNLIFNIL